MLEITVQSNTKSDTAIITTPCRTVQTRVKHAFRVYQRVCANYAFDGQPCRVFEYRDGELFQIFEISLCE